MKQLRWATGAGPQEPPLHSTPVRGDGAGIFDEAAPVELLDNEVVEKLPVGHRHVEAAMRIPAALHAAVAGLALISVRNPVRLGE